jgi:hypothetical protein
MLRGGVSSQFFHDNLHITAFIILFFVGATLVALSPILYRARTNIFLIFISPWDLSQYNKIERRMLFFGILLAVVGILGSLIMTEVYGYYTTYTDISGKTTKIHIQ